MQRATATLRTTRALHRRSGVMTRAMMALILSHSASALPLMSKSNTALNLDTNLENQNVTVNERSKIMSQMVVPWVVIKETRQTEPREDLVQSAGLAPANIVAMTAIDPHPELPSWAYVTITVAIVTAVALLLMDSLFAIGFVQDWEGVKDEAHPPTDAARDVEAATPPCDSVTRLPHFWSPLAKFGKTVGYTAVTTVT